MNLSIKDHIEAGHYPKDDKGRALVPTRNGPTVTIYATDYGKPDDEFPILAGCGREPDRWRANGLYYGGHESSRDLLPPAPRKVEMKRWFTLEASPHSNWMWTSYEGALRWVDGDKSRIVELTGSYEEPWS
jgi:hypothetical protein